MIKSLPKLPVILMLLGLSLVAGSQEDTGYVVQPGDVLQISVWKEEGLQHDVLVRPDGVLSFPLVGDIAAAGNGIDYIRKLVAERLEKYIPEPVVTVAVKSTAGNRFFILGKVARPGEFALNGPLDVMQALSLAGGGTSFADMDKIRILRRSGNGQIVLRFRYSSVAGGRDLAQNVLLQSGDTVVVP